MESKENIERVKCLIIGSGPAGYTAGIYASRANLNPVVYEGLQPGGQLTTTTEIDNFPGYPEGVTGTVMMGELKKQAERFGCDCRWGIVTQVNLNERPFKLKVDGNKDIEADSVIIATGATAKYLGLESEEKFRGSGVSACATCDGFFYRGKDVAVVGGGDTACEEASYLAGLCRKVYLIVRKDFLRASKAMQERVFKTANIEILFEHSTKELTGQNGVEGCILISKSGTPMEKEVKIAIDGFFLAIGHHPNSDVFSDYIDTNEQGYILTQPGTPMTNIKGVFACGDVQDPNYRQAITSAASGCQAAIEAERYLAGMN
ncbi:thioredoxin-disulfide reductase [Labilibaculum sp.]|uniref:thioredoxin-disulfide reductase n=1 Tax=Labilibaculum sp. TaxID=2060723 RepID=UPI002AA76B4B|nr:thioredoxin-disulfide reductase [Labilibaculum sp.]MBN2597914.1 thioredoxin-disulfide reductase [Marinifilaceae bacterium]